jgi:hypothetical protein
MVNPISSNSDSTKDEKFKEKFEFLAEPLDELIQDCSAKVKNQEYKKCIEQINKKIDDEKDFKKLCCLYVKGKDCYLSRAKFQCSKSNYDFMKSYLKKRYEERNECREFPFENVCGDEGTGSGAHYQKISLLLLIISLVLWLLVLSS